MPAPAPTRDLYPLPLYLLPAVLYPLWRLAAPAGTNDPWLYWWLIAAAFGAVAIGAFFVPFIRRHRQGLIYFCASLCTLHHFALISLMLRERV